MPLDEAGEQLSICGGFDRINDLISSGVVGIVPYYCQVIVFTEFSTILAAGFLPNRAGGTLDFVVLAMVLVLLAMGFSIYQVRVKKNPRLHRLLQVVTAIVLLVTLVGFEVDIRLNGWREMAEESPFYDSGLVGWSLVIHLIFAIPTPFIWAGVIGFGLSRFRESFQAGEYNRVHRFWGRVAAAFMIMTAVTGWIFYYLAFVA